MELIRALRLGEHEVVGFVGGGGKTTAMFRLASEIVQSGGRVVTTTTTRIFAAQTSLAPAHLTAPGGSELPPEFEDDLAVQAHVLLTGPVDAAEGKAGGVDPELIARLARRPDIRAVLVEADGSRMRPLKAPAEHEPVVPAETTLLVPMAGADVLGQPLDAVHTHRPELIGGLVGMRAGEVVTPEAVAALLAHPRGGRKQAPPGARVVPLINKVDGAGRLAAARASARCLLRQPEIDSVVLGSVARAEPVAETWGRVAAVVLAAGAASRMGQLKQVMDWGGVPLVARAADVALGSQAGEVLVVVGYESERVAQAVQGRAVRLVANPAWAEGQSASVRAALAALRPSTSAVLFLLADQPFVSAAVVDALIQRHRETLAPIVGPRVNGRRANPVLFDRAAWSALAAVTGDEGGRSLFERYSAQVAWVDWPEAIEADVDTPDDYRALQRRIGG